MWPTKVKAHKGNLFIFDIRLKNFVRQHSISAVCGPDRLESSSKFREISVCVTTYNRKAYGYTFRLGPVFQVILCLFPERSLFHPRLYFCQRWPVIHMCSALKYWSHNCQISRFASYHRPQDLQDPGVPWLTTLLEWHFLFVQCWKSCVGFIKKVLLCLWSTLRKWSNISNPLKGYLVAVAVCLKICS